MMAIKRSEQIDPENAGYYHLISRCVPKTLHGASFSSRISLRRKDIDDNHHIGIRTPTYRAEIFINNQKSLPMRDERPVPKSSQSVAHMITVKDSQSARTQIFVLTKRLTLSQ